MTLEYYREILIRTAAGGHAAAFALLQRAGLPAAAPIIELGAGEGAFLARLQDAGYTQLSAVEIEPGRFSLDLPCAAVDLNGPFATQLPGPYQAVVAVEIIEHLENPSHFLRECRQMVAPGGYLLLTTPNIAQAEGRLRFLRHGLLARFTDDDIHGSGHIAPLPENLLRHHCTRLGWEIVAQTVNAPHAFATERRERSCWRGGPWWKLFWPLLLAQLRGGTLGDMLIFLLRRPD